MYGGKKAESAENEYIKFKRLPFDHCCIGLRPFNVPYCDVDGNIFELETIIAFLKKYKVNPITGKKMDSVKSLIALHFHRNAQSGDYQCPALFKSFSKNSHIVAVATTGNVYSWDAIEQLNIKAKNWKDLIDNTPFQRSDLITIQNPQQLNKFDIAQFYHIRKKLRLLTEEEELELKDPSKRIRTMNVETQETLAQLEQDEKNREAEAGSSTSSAPSTAVTVVADKFNAAHYSTGAVAASFTSTVLQPISKHEPAIIDEDLVKYDRVKKKGYLRLTTNLGPLNLELHCDLVPKTCDNFIKHCVSGYYKATKFHRSIRNFMVNSKIITFK